MPTHATHATHNTRLHRCNTCNRQFWPSNDAAFCPESIEMARGAESGASSPDKVKLAPGWWLRCARSALNQLQAMAKKRVPNLEDDGQDCGAGGGVGDEEALDHPMKPFAVQQKEEAATRQMMEGGGEQASEGERRGLLQKVQERVQEERGRALLLLQVSEEGERRVVGRQPGRGARRRQQPGEEEGGEEEEEEEEAEERESLKRVQAAATALSRYHHRLQGTEPGSGGDDGPTIVEALVELAARDRSGATAHMLESMAVSVRALLHQMPGDEGSSSSSSKNKETS
jgi:hypothetical protein